MRGEGRVRGQTDRAVSLLPATQALHSPFVHAAFQEEISRVDAEHALPEHLPVKFIFQAAAERHRIDAHRQNHHQLPADCHDNSVRGQNS